MSIYIPRVFSNISKEFVANTFEKLLLGDVSRVDFVTKQSDNGETYNAVYVHFHKWHDNQASNSFQERVVNPDKEARIVYDDPWFWICLENKGTKRDPSKPKVRININDVFKVALEKEQQEKEREPQDEDNEDLWVQMMEEYARTQDDQIQGCEMVDADYAWLLEEELLRLREENARLVQENQELVQENQIITKHYVSKTLLNPTAMSV
jgi:GTPase SAR1 family protein